MEILSTITNPEKKAELEAAVAEMDAAQDELTAAMGTDEEPAKQEKLLSAIWKVNAIMESVTAKNIHHPVHPGTEN
jgi:hypothetical protein